MVDFQSLIALVLRLFLYALFARLIIDYIQMLRPEFRPRGILLPLFEIAYTITDKPLGFVRRFIPPLRMGPVALDMSFIVLFFGIQILLSILR